MPASSRCVVVLGAMLLMAGCAGATGKGGAPTTSDPDGAGGFPNTSPDGNVSAAEEPVAEASNPESLLVAAEDALAADAPARAVALFARALGTGPTDDVAARAYPGMARGHEALGDCASAVRAYSSFLAQLPEHERRGEILMRKGACEAELEDWTRSAKSYAEAASIGRRRGALPSTLVEAHAREGFAWFHADEYAPAMEALDQADAVYEEAMRTDAERFSTYYFVGMARFYRGAVWHRRFREVEIRAGDRHMAADFQRKLELLTKAQEHYNDTIRAKHVFWVSAAGYQMGSLFEEFYDALMYAPVPKWLSDKQRETYYEELKTQLRPVVNKAIWVFEKNLETARRLGYDNPFIEKTEQQLARLQGVLLSGDATLGAPHPRLAPVEVRSDPGSRPQGDAAIAVHAPTGDSGTPSQDPGSLSPDQPLPAVDRKLFVPMPTSL